MTVCSGLKRRFHLEGLSLEWVLQCISLFLPPTPTLFTFIPTAVLATNKPASGRN